MEGREGGDRRKDEWEGEREKTGGRMSGREKWRRYEEPVGERGTRNGRKRGIRQEEGEVRGTGRQRQEEWEREWEETGGRRSGEGRR